jgi:tRNA threonylcarbamoyladenosine biosynthesis protein TsaE
MTTTLKLALPNESATEQLGRLLAHVAADLHEQPGHSGQVLPGPNAGGRIHLQGDLGAGKTHLVRALLRECGVTGRIKSPSYALLESYKVLNLYLYHLDFYRFSDPNEWQDAGFKEILRNDVLVLIEWPEHAGKLLSDPDLLIQLEYVGDARRASLHAYTNKGVKWLDALTDLGKRHHLDLTP